jgi:hypothetical protein
MRRAAQADVKQIPKPKTQIPNPNLAHWDLGFGIWDLVID